MGGDEQGTLYSLESVEVQNILRNSLENWEKLKNYWAIRKKAPWEISETKFMRYQEIHKKFYFLLFPLLEDKKLFFFCLPTWTFIILEPS